MKLSVLQPVRLRKPPASCSFQQLFWVQTRQLYASGSLQKATNSSHKTDQPFQPSCTVRACLVTGGSSGIGYEITKRLVQDEKCLVTFTTRDSEKGRRTIQRVKEDLRLSNPRLNFIETDLQNPNGASVLWQSFRENSGKDTQINTLINCAGLSQSGPLVATPTSGISDILRVNLDTPIQLSRALLKEYLRLGQKLKSQLSQSPEALPASFNIINVSSLLAYRSGSGASVYSASKAGLVAVSRALTLEAATIRSNHPNLPPFRINSVVPGYIDTPMISNFSEAYRNELKTKIPLGRFGTAAEVADAAMFLLGNEYANNTVLTLDGGLSAV